MTDTFHDGHLRTLDSCSSRFSALRCAGGIVFARQEIDRAFLRIDQRRAVVEIAVVPIEEQVALRRLPPELAADPVALGDLKREVQKAHRLSHPNIIRIHDLVQLPEEQPFIAMEFVDGADLAAMRAQQPDGLYRWENVAPLALQMCDALN